MGERQRRAGGRDTVGAAVAAELLDPPLIGRDDAVAQLHDHVAAASTSGFRVGLIVGAAGVGKTRLAAEVLAHHADDTRRLIARCYRWGSAASFAPWAEALNREFRGWNQEELRDLLGPWAAGLSSVLTAAAELCGPQAFRARREQVLEGLVGVLGRLARRGPVLVHLDDVHLADSSSWDALRYLERRLGDAPIAVLMTARPAPLEESPVIMEVLLGLDEEARLCRVPLRPLSRAEVARLAHDVIHASAHDRSAFVTEPLISWLMERSLGHPLFAIGLLRALLEEGADLTAPRLERLPANLRERVVLEVQALDETARRLLELLAVADLRLELPDLHRLGVGDDGDLVAALDVLTRTRLISERRDGPRLTYELSHPIVQEAVYETIGGARRRALHRHIAEGLLASGALGAAAGHLVQGAEPGDPTVVLLLRRAMSDAEARGLHRESLAILAALVDLLPADDERWPEVLDAMGWQPEWVLSHLAETDAPVAITAMQRIAAQLADTDDAAARATVQFHLASFLSFGAGQLDEARAAGASAVRLFGEAGQPERQLLARNELAWLHGCAGEFVRQGDEARAVVDDAVRSGHLRAALQAAATCGYALGILGRFDASEEVFRKGSDLAREQGNRYRIAWIGAQQARILGLAGRLDDARRSADAALQHADRAPDVLAFESRAHTHWLAGDLAAAAHDLEVVSTHRPVRGSRRHAWGAALAARIHAERGDTARAERTLQLAADTYRGEPFLDWGWWQPFTEAFLDWVCDDREGALSRYDRVADQLRDLGAAPYEMLVLVESAWCAFEHRDADHAALASRRLGALATDLGGELHAGLAGIGTAVACLAAGDDRAAGEASGRAERQLTDRGYLLHAAQAGHVLGRALTRSDRPQAVTTLERAAQAFATAGASWRRDRVLEELTRLGSRGRRTAAAVQGPAALSNREREVAVLAAQGFTAKEIGERLFIGHRTVESHLAHCYAKLGISSRGELIRQADRLGPVDTTP